MCCAAAFKVQCHVLDRPDPVADYPSHFEVTAYSPHFIRYHETPTEEHPIVLSTLFAFGERRKY